MKFHTHAAAMLILLCMLATGLPSTTNAQSQRCFSETTDCIMGPIRAYWERNGGVAVFGYPITAQRAETVEGRTLQVQWFERDRLEIQADGSITSGRLGAQLLELQGRPWQRFVREEPNYSRECGYFDPTGFNVCGAFRLYWENNGGVARFGYPISPVMDEVIEGRTYSVQYFERRRMEYHPENPAPNTILLGLLGREVLHAEATTPAPANLIGQPWHWVSTFDTANALAPVEAAGTYTIAFAEDGTVAVQADCNQVRGAYRLGDNGALTITLGPSTLVACPPGSRGDEFTRLLGTVTNYDITGIGLTLQLAPGGDFSGLVFDRVE